MPGKGDLSEESYLKKLGNMRADLEKIELELIGNLYKLHHSSAFFICNLDGNLLTYKLLLI